MRLKVLEAFKNYGTFTGKQNCVSKSALGGNGTDLAGGTASDADN